MIKKEINLVQTSKILECLPNYASVQYKILSNSPKLKVKFPDGVAGSKVHAFDLGNIEDVNISDTLFCPIEAVLNPHYEAVKEEILIWAEQGGFFSKAEDKERFVKADFALLGCWCYPDLAHKDLLLSVKWLTFLFYHDDRFDNKKSQDSKDISAIIRSSPHIFGQ